MENSPQLLKPEYEWVEQPLDESIHYIEHGVPSPLIRWHHHKEYELHLVRHTTGKYFVGDHIGTFRPGNLVLVAPDLPHNWISDLGPGESIDMRDQVVHFSVDFLQGLQSQLPELRTLEPMLERARLGVEFYGPRIIKQAQTLFDQLSSTRGLKRLLHFMTLMELLASTDEYRTLSSELHQPLIDKSNLDWLNKAVDYILEHYEGEISLEEVASHMEVSPTYFSKQFKRASGHRFVDFVNRLRVNKAAELLTHSHLPITDICFEVGYNNIANFNRRFLEIKGITPSDYRKSFIYDLGRG
ncbi:AraC family transcriptional regulator [Hahella sp. CCB-MM4]|uniref:AraC family transcriptional regulator n=1 Tax=Hahella sp. (strain CCB-MM4) TaxID=1926491 RepID=UPI000B9AE8CF|nr:AraC family transcriptional regulator [Hahella sp. CCB-MM4]OZG73299.1 AraC family transcriptional regulator [Hahella sp. CCB-MM4]